MPVTTLYVATSNPGKLRDFAAAARSFSQLSRRFTIAPMPSLDRVPPPVEDELTFKSNARLKAIYYSRLAPGLDVLADDSGLVVDALDGAPGIYSARWAGPDKDFQRAMETVEEKLRERGATLPKRRTAHFVSALCVAWPEGHTEEFEGRVTGALVWPPRGDKGFGYDAIFQPDGHTRTFGEMPSEEKHGLPPRGKGLSHRARAFLKLAEACLD